MKFRVVTPKENKEIFVDLFRANRILFEDVRVRTDGPVVEFMLIPRTVLVLKAIQSVLLQEKHMGTEFQTFWDLGD